MPCRRKRIPENSIQCRVFKHKSNSGVCCAEPIDARSSQATGRGGMKFEKRKVAHEHIWWDQASLLVQVGVLDPGNLPMRGVEQARELLRIAQSQGLVLAKGQSNN